MTLKSFASGRLEAATALEVSNHLLAGCAQCSALLTTGQHPIEPALGSPEARAWVRRLSNAEDSRLRFELNNADTKQPLDIAAAALGLNDEIALPSALLEWCLERLTLSANDDESFDLLVGLASQLCRRHRGLGHLSKAVAVLELGAKAATHRHISAERRADYLVECATLERAGDGAAVLERLPIESRWAALAEAQQLFLLTGDAVRHAECVLQSIEIVLFGRDDQAEPRPKIREIVRGLELLTGHLESAPNHRLELLARYYLVVALDQQEEWTRALLACERLVLCCRTHGDRPSELTAELHAARLTERSGQSEAALVRFQQVRSALELHDQPLLATQALLEEAELAASLGRRSHLIELSTRMALLLAAGAADTEALPLLLLAREQLETGSIEPGLIRHCLDGLWQPQDPLT